MNSNELLALYDQQQRLEIVYPGLRREVTSHAVRHVNDGDPLEWGMVIYSKLDEQTADTAIREQVAYFQSIGQSFEWKVYGHDKPADLQARLLAQGFVADEEEAIMALEVTAAPDLLQGPINADIRRITDPADLKDVTAIEEQVWQEDFSQLEQRLASYLRYHPRFLSVYVAYVDGQPASCAWMDYTDNSQFAGLWGGSTMPTYRQRGLYTALLAIRLQEAQARGIRFLTVDASPMSQPILAKYGFQLLTTAVGCNWSPEQPPGP
jgi:GNAT superfamily N-acetyltransferase